MVCLCGVMEDPDMGTDTRKWPAVRRLIANTNFPLRLALPDGVAAPMPPVAVIFPDSDTPDLVLA